MSIIGELFKRRSQKWNQSLHASKNDGTDEIVQAAAVLEQAPIFRGMRLGIRYIDSKNEQSERVVRVLNAEERSGVRYIQAFCELRNGVRKFKIANIGEVIDVTTGEIFNDVDDFFEQFFNFDGTPVALQQVPPASSSTSDNSEFLANPNSREAALQTLIHIADELSILCLLSLADGRQITIERDLILEYALGRAENLDIKLGKSSKQVLRDWISVQDPSEDDIRYSIEKLASHSPFTIPEFIATAKSVVAADAVMTQDEQRILKLVMDEVKRQTDLLSD